MRTGSRLWAARLGWLGVCLVAGIKAEQSVGFPLAAGGALLASWAGLGVLVAWSRRRRG